MKRKRIKTYQSSKKNTYQIIFSCIEQHNEIQQKQMWDSLNQLYESQQPNEKTEEFWKESKNSIDIQIQFQHSVDWNKTNTTSIATTTTTATINQND